MPVVDMPLAELHHYIGRTECPEDLDCFWDRSISEMEALGTHYTLEKAAFQLPGIVDCFHLYFMGIGGAKIHCHFVRPAGKIHKAPAVLIFHGYSGAAASFSSLVAYAAQGFVVAAMDCRGQSGKSEDVGGVQGNTLHGHIIRGLEGPSPDQLYFRNVFLDTAQLARIVMAMDEVDETRVGAFGDSQGGGLTLACAALTPTLNRIAPKVAFLCDYRRVWEMDLAKGAYAELVQFFRQADPLHEHEKEVFAKLGYIDNIHLAHRIQAKVLMFTGLMDTTCPPSTQFAAYNHITSPKEMKIYPDYGHEDLPEADNMTMLFLREMFDGHPNKA